MKKGLAVFLFAWILLTTSAAPGDEPRPAAAEKVGPVSDVLLAIGFSTNEREGLHPRHVSGSDNGLRIDGRFFLSTLVDNPYLGGIGVGGYFNTVFDIDYGISGDEWSASQIQWQVEALYRFTLSEVFFQPTFMLRVGYGETSCIIDTDHTLALSVLYGYPYGAFDFYLMLLKPFVRLHMSVGYLFAVDLGEDLKGSGTGYTIRGGIDLALFGHVHVGLGMEWFKFSFVDEAIGDTTDSYEGLFFRIGWNYH
jgi:opacity protein-like surface antigen